MDNHRGGMWKKRQVVRYGSGDLGNFCPGHFDCPSPWDTNVPDHGGANDKCGRRAAGVTVPFRFGSSRSVGVRCALVALPLWRAGALVRLLFSRWSMGVGLRGRRVAVSGGEMVSKGN